jgi:predicted amidohydrolase YtcJ
MNRPVFRRCAPQDDKDPSQSTTMPDPADLIVTNANVLTMNAAQPRATAMALHGGRIMRVGDDAEIIPLAGPSTLRLDLAGKTVVPGFHDCHLHLLWYGTSLVAEANLVGCASIEELLTRLAAHASTSTGWILGHGFDQEKLAERRFPTREELDRVSAGRPTFITRVCAHAAVANLAALALLTPDERHAGDAASGLFTETAITPIAKKIPPLDDEALERALLAACKVALRTGITSAQTMLEDIGQWRTYQRLHARLGGRLPLRMTVMPPQADAEFVRHRGSITGTGDDWLRMGGVKFFSDGSLGARTALLAAPYADAPDAGLGQRIYAPEVFNRRAAEVAAMGFQIVIHAIGDQALRESIDAIDFALAGRTNVLRHRIEHASVVPPDQFERLARLGIQVAIQPQFVTSDTWTGDRLGTARTPWAYPFASMRRAGVNVGLSSDAPVEKLDAFECLASAVGRHAWSPHETLTPLEAIRAYTAGSASCAHRERDVGSLEPRKLADFVVLSADPSAMDADQLRALRAERVFIGGVEATSAG